MIEGWGTAVFKQILEVSIDLSVNYKSLVQKLLPDAEVIADRFHVMKIINQDLDAARKALRKANENTLDKENKDRIEAALLFLLLTVNNNCAPPVNQI